MSAVSPATLAGNRNIGAWREQSPAAVAQNERAITWQERRNAETAHTEVIVRLRHVTCTPSPAEIAAERERERQAGHAACNRESCGETGHAAQHAEANRLMAREAARILAEHD